MKLVYYDESGDPGFPKYQTLIFLQTFIYFPASEWKFCFEKILQCLREIKEKFNLPVRLELHAREFILKKTI